MIRRGGEGGGEKERGRSDRKGRRGGVIGRGGEEE